MKWFYNLKIAARLIIGFILVAIIAGVVGFVGITDIHKMKELDTEMYERHTATLDDLSIIIDGFQKSRVLLRDMIIHPDATTIENAEASIEELDQHVLVSLDEFEKGLREEKTIEEFDIVKNRIISEFMPYKDKIIEMVKSGEIVEATSYMYSEGADIATSIQDSINTLFELKVELAKQSSATNDKAADDATLIMIIVVVVGILIAIILGLFISNSISKPIKEMVSVADHLALGDVNVRLDVNSKDEIGILAQSFTKMIENIRVQAMIAERIASGDLTVDVTIRSENDLLGKKLAEMVEHNNEVLTNIASASEQVAVGSKQVSDSSIIISQGATEQASSIEVLTASLEEISSQTKLNAESADQAKNLAEGARYDAVQGNSHMKDMLNAIEEINESSANISKIIKVIDDIAFQTNILALNAAVEAARAGQHGKGFAVVAEEVRNLAARSANAAKETTDMIEGSIKKTEYGTRIAKETADALGKIVDDVEKVAALVNDIANASNEQSIGINQINQGIMQVSDVIQNNTATSEESAAASEELSSQAGLLKDMVSKFKLKYIIKNHNRMDDIDPEVLQMLENMSDKRKSKGNVAKTKEEAVATKHTIVLGDNEFGKY